jgi:hypothetical protein
MNRTKKQLPTKPFFTRFLEQQSLEEVTGGVPNHTLKYPSDSDETVAASYHDM